MSIAAPSELVADVLRGNRDDRPPTDRTLAAVLHGALERGVDAALAIGDDEPVHVTSADLRGWPTTSPSALSSRMRGAFLAHVLDLLVAGYAIGDPYEDALAVWRADANSSELRAYERQLTADARAQLVTDVNAHAVTLMERLGQIGPAWLPRTRQRTFLRLACGRAHLHDLADLVVGSPWTPRASVAILDVTTAPLGDETAALLRYHALAETLRSSVVPLRVVALSTATGDVATLDVTADDLTTAVNDTVALVARGRP